MRAPSLAGPARADIPHAELARGEVLAPMVRACELPLRLEALRYGCACVYTEETLDSRLAGLRRVPRQGGVVDFLQGAKVVFSTHELERGRVVLQLGTAEGPRAVEAALAVAGDVAGVDVNMGCPQAFSVDRGMGAALLEAPHRAADILKSLRRCLPETVRVSCKVRLLEDQSETRDFLQLCERSGAEAIALHLRTVEERPRHSAHWDRWAFAKSCVTVPLVANGDFLTGRDIQSFREANGAETPVMVGRGALWNPAIFAAQPVAKEEVVRRYVERCVAVGTRDRTNARWCVSQMACTEPCVAGTLKRKLAYGGAAAQTGLAAVLRARIEALGKQL